MHVTLLVPDLLWPRASREAYEGLELPALELILARARRRLFPPLGLEAWLCRAFEVERQQDWPVAPLMLAFDGGEPGEDYWLCADPVHLEARRDRLVLFGPEVVRPTREESDALVAALNRHFAADAIAFAAPHPERWYLRAEPAPRLVTRELSAAAGAEVEMDLPAGEDGPRWRRLLNEIQMLLHDHPVNQAREARGAPTANGLWLWGGGRLPRVPGRPFSHVAAGNPLALALAARSDAEPAVPGALTGRCAPAACDRNARVLVLAETPAARYGDGESWRRALAEVERAWGATLLAALRERRVTSLAVVALHPRACLRFEANAADLLKFWRRPRPLAAHAPAAH
ncbi:MAG TPA: hypothetical protein VNK67_12875 [Burkholderiales bacterium]|nr:hypothetical protein [Burkholderiales bacterium]